MSLEKERIKMQIKRVQLAADEMDLKILEREEEIERLKTNKKKQLETVSKLKEELASMGE